MNIASDQELCAFINGLTQEQFDHFIENDDTGPLLYEHIAFCSNNGCGRVCADYERRLRGKIEKEGKNLSSHEVWKKGLLLRELIHDLRAKGILGIT
jgi:hypothetical protein